MLDLKTSLFTNTFLNLSEFISGWWTVLSLRFWFVSFFFGIIIIVLSGQLGSTERTLKSFVSAFLEGLECPFSLICISF